MNNCSFLKLNLTIIGKLILNLMKNYGLILFKYYNKKCKSI